MAQQPPKTTKEASTRKTRAPGHAWKPAFLAAYERLGVIATTARQVGVDKATVHHAIRDDPEFAEAFEQSKEVFIDRLEQEATRRAIEGCEEPVYQQGRKVGTRLRYSDQLMQFLLERRRYPRSLRIEAAANASDEAKAICAGIAAGLATIPERPPESAETNVAKS